MFNYEKQSRVINAYGMLKGYKENIFQQNHDNLGIV